LRVAEQANEEKIIGKEHLPLDFEQAELKNDATTAAMNDPFSCGGRRKPTREQ
jgi:hypothetical protein